MEIKAVIFDLDGLLVDSEPYWDLADRSLLKKLGVDLSKTENEVFRKKMLGRGQRECAEIYIKEFKLKETVESFIDKRWAELYSILLKNLKPMPKAKETVLRFSSQNLALALATGGHTEQKAREILEKLGILNDFRIVVSGLDVKKSKPSPDIYLKCAKLLNLKTIDCLVLEDAPNGILAAKAAKMNAYGVNPDAKMRIELKKAGADEVYPSLDEVEI